MDSGVKQIQQQLYDPVVPEEAKNELRKALEEMGVAKGWADLVMNKAKSVTNILFEKEEIELNNISIPLLKRT